MKLPNTGKYLPGRYCLMATVNQHPPVHHEGWMVSGQEIVFCWFPVAELTMVVSSMLFLTTYLLTT